jgi:hypothetical protein
MRLRSSFLSFLAVALAPVVVANPEPDIPVHVALGGNRDVTIRIEIDPRCFTADPMGERFYMKADLGRDTQEEMAVLKTQALALIRRDVIFTTEPDAAPVPQFTLAFTGQNQAALVKADDPVVITATWKLPKLPALKSLRVHAAKGARFAIVLRHSLKGVESERLATLFPGEASFPLAIP